MRLVSFVMLLQETWMFCCFSWVFGLCGCTFVVFFCMLDSSTAYYSQRVGSSQDTRENFAAWY